MNCFRLIRHARQAYADSLAEQRQGVEAILARESPNLLILTEHPPVYTMGRSGRQAEILDTLPAGAAIPVLETDRGGRVTYHGPGQMVAYVLLDLASHAREVRRHVWRLEESVIQTLAILGVTADRDPAGPGIWVGAAKIGALGVRIRRGVTSHGLSLNREPDLRHFSGIIPCGFADRPVTSLAALGHPVRREELEEVFIRVFEEVFSVHWEEN
ncbi:MAG: lipoyl(octanoyl) transferase LipB [Magnetococcales bacterium]|nr:lipoyl(octanoyl) transferase LipB [Magnetococcales bacterium]